MSTTGHAKQAEAKYDAAIAAGDVRKAERARLDLVRAIARDDVARDLQREHDARERAEAEERERAAAARDGQAKARAVDEAARAVLAHYVDLGRALMAIHDRLVVGRELRRALDDARAAARAAGAAATVPVPDDLTMTVAAALREAIGTSEQPAAVGIDLFTFTRAVGLALSF